eukprot:3372687-Alexandrium_andersonii.AAC.1
MGAGGAPARGGPAPCGAAFERPAQSLSARAFAGFRALATGGTRPRRVLLSPSTWRQAGLPGRWQHERTTLAYLARTWGSRLRTAAGG